MSKRTGPEISFAMNDAEYCCSCADINHSLTSETVHESTSAIIRILVMNEY